MRQDQLVTLIHLVQHGDKERGAGDPGLTALGTRQADLTGRWLRERGLHGLYSSPLRRAGNSRTDRGCNGPGCAGGHSLARTLELGWQSDV